MKKQHYMRIHRELYQMLKKEATQLNIGVATLVFYIFQEETGKRVGENANSIHKEHPASKAYFLTHNKNIKGGKAKPVMISGTTEIFDSIKDQAKINLTFDGIEEPEQYKEYELLAAHEKDAFPEKYKYRNYEIKLGKRIKLVQISYMLYHLEKNGFLQIG